MVRKWSYLNNINLDTNNESNCFFKKIYNLKVFKKTTRFKKYNIDYTLMVRKQYSKRKHQTSWINLSYITKSWVHIFLKSKQFVRFYQNLGLFSIQSYSSNLLVFNKKLTELTNFNGINSFSCSKNVINSFLHYSNTNIFFNNPIKNNSSSGILVRNNTALSLSLSVTPNLVQYDNTLYPIIPTTENLHLYSIYQSLNFKYVLQFSLTIYQILIILSLKNIHTTL